MVKLLFLLIATFVVVELETKETSIQKRWKFSISKITNNAAAAAKDKAKDKAKMCPKGLLKTGYKQYKLKNGNYYCLKAYTECKLYYICFH